MQKRRCKEVRGALISSIIRVTVKAKKIYLITPWVSSETLPTVVPGLRLSIGAPLLFNHTWRFWVSRLSHAECSTCAHKAFFFFFFFNVTWNVIICGNKLFWFRSDKACLTGYLGMRVQRWHGPWIILGRGGGPQREVVPRSGSRVWVCARARCRLRQRWNDQHVILRPWRSHKSQQRMSRAHAHKKKKCLSIRTPQEGKTLASTRFLLLFIIFNRSFLALF